MRIFQSRRFPPPQRLWRRLSLRNERHLYPRTCDLSGKKMASVFSPDSPYKIYDQDEWWSDRWDPTEYGRPFDYEKTFTENMRALLLDVPHQGLYTKNVENSYYSNYALNVKNCYFLFGAGESEDCLYSRFIHQSRDVVEGLSLFRCELCYEGVASDDCYDCRYFLNSRSCSSCTMIENCESCTNCMLCYGLYRAEHCILNRKVSKAEYDAFLASITPLTPEKIIELERSLAELKANLPLRGAHIYASEDCSGDMIYNCKNCHHAFDTIDSEDCYHISFAPRMRMCLDNTYTAPLGNRFCYEVCSTVGSEECMATFLCWHGSRVRYSFEINNCNELFACVGLKQKEYHILNKPYSPEAYEQEVRKIVTHMQKTGEWGEYLSPSLSFFAYNETVASEYFPLSKEQALQHGLRWRDKKPVSYDETQVVTPDPDIRNVSDDILNAVLLCGETGEPYKLTSAELRFYRKMNLPIPRFAPGTRHLRRHQKRQPRQLWQRHCDRSGKLVPTCLPDVPRGRHVFSSEAFTEAMRAGEFEQR